MPPQYRVAAPELFLISPIGIYIHIPFCKNKCNYCNFYSKSNSCETTVKKYCNRVISDLKHWGAEISRPVSSVYFGGGTPTVLGGENIKRILECLYNNFHILPNAEITVEGNPSSNLEKTAEVLKSCGCNRFSMGMQSANENELSVLGRLHTPKDVENAVAALKLYGITNISVDLMLGLPGSTTATLQKSIDFALSLNVPHISAYILKLEPGTPLYKSDARLNIPNDDEIADQYLHLCKALESSGYEHYEISNFAKPGFYAKHNTAYWQCKEYIGIGPAAHSFYNGKRFYCEPDLTKYINSPEIPIIPDGNGGGPEEFIMLGLRLKSGISNTEFNARYGYNLPQDIYKKADILKKQKLCTVSGDNIALTNRGMLVSNALINYFSEEL